MPPTSAFHRSIAVVIGIDAYDHGISRLRTAVADATRIADLLRTQHGYEVLRLLNEEATHERLTTLLTATLPQEVGPDDRVFFYFAGHGVAIDGDEGPNGYLIPQDAVRGDPSTFLHMPRIHDALLALPCRHMLVVLDSCFSGAFRWSSTRGDPLGFPEEIHQERFDRFVRDPAWQVITSAAQDQRAADSLSVGSLGHRADDGNHSPFALALVEGLSGEADLVPKGGGDGVITATELYLYLEARLQPESIDERRRQTPRLWPLKKHDKGEFIFFTPGRDVTLPPAPPLTYENNPYRGLASFDTSDAALFFGRERVVKALVSHVAQRPLTVVLGASGTGKSSVVRAGLIPLFAADERFDVLPVMRIALLAGFFLPAATTPDDAAAEFDMVEVLVQRLEQHPGRTLVMVVDQMEELVTQVRSPQARSMFLTRLGDLIRRCGDRVRVIVTLRSDFEPQLADSALNDFWTPGRFIVPPMTQAELRDVIERPASERVLYFSDDSLVDNLIDEVVQTPGGLPLLSFTLSEMYVAYVNRRGSDRALSRKDYDKLGGVIGALQQRANEVHASFDEAHRSTMRRVMLRLVEARGGTLLRRRAPAFELEYPDSDGGAENARVQRVVEALVEARLIVRGLEPNGSGYLEPAHDALVSAWGRLIDWVRDFDTVMPDFATGRKLALAAADWRAAPVRGNRGVLWTDGARASMLARLLHRHAIWLNRAEFEFARLSVRGRRWRQASVGLSLATLLTVAAVAAYQGLRAQANAMQAEKNAATAQSRALAIVAANESQLDQAILIAAESLRRDDNYDSRNAVLTKALAPGFQLRATLPCPFIAFSPDDHTVALECNGDVTFVDDRTGYSAPVVPDAMSIIRNHPGSFSYDGRLFASTGAEVRLWNVAARTLLDARLPGGARVKDDDILAVFSPTRPVLAYANDGKIRLWNADGGVQTDEFDGGGAGVHAIAFSPDGRTLAFNDNDPSRPAVGFWDIDAHTKRQPFAVPAPLTALAYSPDGRILAAATAKPALQLVDIAHNLVVDSSDAKTRIANLAFYDERTIFSADQDGFDEWTVTPSLDATRRGDRSFGARFGLNRRQDALAMGSSLWRLRPRAPIASRLAGSDAVADPGSVEPFNGLAKFAFSPDGKTLASAGTGSTIRLWDTATKALKGRLAGHQSIVASLAFSADGHILASGGRDAVRLWDVDARRSLRPPLWVSGVDAEPVSEDTIRVGFVNGSTVLAAMIGGHLKAWNVSTGRAIDGMDSTPTSEETPEFDPDGRVVALPGSSRPTQLWDLVANKSIGELPETSIDGEPGLFNLAFSGNGRVLAVSRPESLQLYDAKTRHTWGPRLRGRGPVTLSEDGGSMALLDRSNNIRLVDTVTGQETVIDLQGERTETSGRATVISFSGHDRILAIGFMDGGIRLLDLTSAGLIAFACRSVPANLPAATWMRWFPERPYECTCPRLRPGDGARCQ